MRVEPPKGKTKVRLGLGLVTGPITVDDKLGADLIEAGWVELDAPRPITKSACKRSANPNEDK